MSSLISHQESIGARRTPAFFSYKELEEAGVTNCTGFDRTLFRLRHARASEQQILAALNEVRNRFLWFAWACSVLNRPLYLLWELIRFRPIARGQTRRSYLQWHLAWARLWWLEWRAGPVTALGVTP